MIDICSACGYKTKVVDYATSGFDPAKHSPERKTKLLCNLCAHTLTGRTADLYSSTHSIRDNQDVLQTLNYIGNAILEKLERIESLCLLPRVR